MGFVGFSLAFAFTFVRGASFSVMTRHKERGNGEEVVGEVAELVRVLAWTVNHELDACLSKDVFDEVSGKSTQSVFVQDGNLADQPTVSGVQNGTQSEVEP